VKKLIFIILSIILFSCSKEKKSDEAAAKMQDFVINISSYARSLDSNFIIIPQNGIELAFPETDTSNGLNMAYMDAIDGFGVEELFYNGPLVVDNEQLSTLQILKSYKKILVSDYLGDDQYLTDDISRNLDQGFICFPRLHDDYYYNHLPETVINENTDDITSLGQAQNYLYLISTDLFSSKETMLEDLKSTNYDVLLIDLFYEDNILISSEVEQLKTKANGGKRLVIGYMNVGSAENYRYYWKDGWKLHNPNWIKKKYTGYDDEFIVEFWVKEWQDIIFGNDDSYLKKIIDAGFDGAYLDNVEAYYFLYYNNKDI
jgi:cysteinyl-tRNA synthetase, unknown class